MRAGSVKRCQPPVSAIQPWYADADLLDAYCLRLPDDAPQDARVLARLTLTNPPSVFRALMALRDFLVTPAGIKSSDDIRSESDGRSRIDIFPVIQETRHEVVIGEDDRHLDFRTSMMIVPDGSSSLFVSTTAVKCHNRVGRAYLAVIRPFHIAIVKAGLRRLGHRSRQSTSE